MERHRNHRVCRAAALFVALWLAAASYGHVHVDGDVEIRGIERLASKDGRVSITLNNVPALKAFQAIANAGGFELKYAGPIDCCVSNYFLEGLTVEQALENVMSGSAADCRIIDPATVRVELPEIVLPILLTKSEPIYPKDARAAHAEGKITLMAVIREDGTVSDVTVVEGVKDWPSMNQSAIDCVRNRTYRPATKNGVSVAYDFVVTIEFRLH